MNRRWIQAGLVGMAAAGSMGLGTAMAFAGTSGTATYNYPSTIRVTITSANASLQPVPPTGGAGLKFYFSNQPEGFTPTGSDGQVTFSPTAGLLPATSVTIDPASQRQKYVYDVGVPASYQNMSSPNLYVVSNYQWEQLVPDSAQPIDNYSSLENLVQQLPEVPLALLIPAAIGGAVFLRRKRGLAKVSAVE